MKIKSFIKLNTDFYIIKPNIPGKSQQCCMEGNLGNCWLACHGYHCVLTCSKEHLEKLENPIYSSINVDILNSILYIVKNTRVNDGYSYDEQESLVHYVNYLLEDYKKNIYDNRILCDKTFAIRAYSFLKDLIPDTKDEENILNTIICILKDLFNFQLITCSSDEEIKYMKNINHIDNDNNIILL